MDTCFSGGPPKKFSKNKFAKILKYDNPGPSRADSSVYLRVSGECEFTVLLLDEERYYACHEPELRRLDGKIKYAADHNPIFARRFDVADSAFLKDMREVFPDARFVNIKVKWSEVLGEP